MGFTAHQQKKAISRRKLKIKAGDKKVLCNISVSRHDYFNINEKITNSAEDFSHWL